MKRFSCTAAFRLPRTLRGPRRLTFLFATLLATATLAQDVLFKSTTKLVVVDVFARDKSGNDLLNLKKEDFVILEDGKPQQIGIFELQKLDAEPAPAPTETKPTQAKAQTIVAATPGQIQYRDKRLLVFFFDLSSMPAADQLRSQQAGVKFLKEQMKPADLVAVMTYGTTLKVEQDFTADRDRLLEVINGLRFGPGGTMADGATGDDADEDTGAAFQADESEFNIFNTDRKLSALEQAAKMLGALPEKKALVYFSSGINKTGMENESQLRSTVNAAVRANLSFYPIDARGLTAQIPGGDASKGASRGDGLFSGRSQRQQGQKFQNQQETLVSLAADTGGKSFLDSNDLSLGIQQAQQDIRSYYVIGYYSTNPATDGKFRRVQVKLADQKLQAKLDYRSGYFAPKDFSKYNNSDKEQQLEEALALGDPVTDLPIALEVNHFRLARDRYFIPIAVKIPGSEIALARKGQNETAELDFIGQVRDSKGRLTGTVRDSIQVKLTGENAGQLEKRNLQYDSGFTLAPGDYKLKFLARENQTGKLGTFETAFTVPDLQATAGRLKTSSLVLGAQRERLKAAVGTASNNRRLLAANPLVEKDQKLVPSITRVFKKGQSLYIYLEVYDLPPGDQTSLFTALSFYRGRAKAFESEPVRVTQALAKRPGVYPVQFEIPLAQLASGAYTCQLTLIDEVGKSVAFPRSSMIVVP